MTFWGWLIMVLSVGGVTALFAWCIHKVLTTPGETDHVHGFEQEPPDARSGKARKQSPRGPEDH